MKRTVTVKFEIDPTEYGGAKDTPWGTLALVASILDGEADFPPEGTIELECEGVRKTIEG